jgi:large subunit ribosomal protein L18
MMIMAKATGPTYKVAFRRRRKNLTDYKKRLGLIKSDAPRMVVRVSNRGVLIQITRFSEKGDMIEASARTEELSKFGWVPQSNTPSAYLTGMLAAKRAIKKGIENANLDMGMKTANLGSVSFAAALGANDAGLKVALEEQIIQKDRINGKHISEYAKNLKEKDEALYSKKFSSYIKNKVDVTKLPEIFEQAKKKIVDGE